MATQAQNHSAYIRELSFVVTTLLLDLTLSVGREQAGIENGQSTYEISLKGSKRLRVVLIRDGFRTSRAQASKTIIKSPIKFQLHTNARTSKLLLLNRIVLRFRLSFFFY